LENMNILNDTTKKMRRFAHQLYVAQRGTAGDKSVTNPQFHWWAGILFALLILVGGGCWSVWLYMQHHHVEPTATSESVDSVVYRQVLVQSAIATMQARERAVDTILRNWQNRSVVVIEADEAVEGGVLEGGSATEPEFPTSTATTTIDAEMPLIDPELGAVEVPEEELLLLE
jgi:hypothetical protein